MCHQTIQYDQFYQNSSINSRGTFYHLPEKSKIVWWLSCCNETRSLFSFINLSLDLLSPYKEAILWLLGAMFFIRRDYVHPIKAWIKEIWKLGSIWEWDLGCAVKAISSPSIRSPCVYVCATKPYMPLLANTVNNYR